MSLERARPPAPWQHARALAGGKLETADDVVAAAAAFAALIVASGISRYRGRGIYMALAKSYEERRGTKWRINVAELKARALIPGKNT